VPPATIAVQEMKFDVKSDAGVATREMQQPEDAEENSKTE
jgi:hypothetical protein